MALTTGQKSGLIARTLFLARDAGELKKQIDAISNEFVAEGGASTVIATGDLTAHGPSDGLTGTEFADGVTALTNIASTIETNKTNLFKIAEAASTV